MYRILKYIIIKKENIYKIGGDKPKPSKVWKKIQKQPKENEN